MSTSHAQSLRKRATDAEKLLWRHLRGRMMDGVKFRRQHPIGRYIVDFVSLRERLVIELDGGPHALTVEEDKARAGWLMAEGYRVLRFWNSEVFENLDGVLATIRAEALNENHAHAPSP